MGNLYCCTSFKLNYSDVEQACKIDFWDVEKPCENCLRDWGMTPVFRAVWSGHPKCIESFAKEGADVNGVDDIGRTPLIQAAWRGYYECVDTLIYTSRS